MKKLLMISTILAFSSAAAYAGNINVNEVAQYGALNGAFVLQTGNHNLNINSTTQAGGFNKSATIQSGWGNVNASSTTQIGFGNSDLVLQN